MMHQQSFKHLPATVTQMGGAELSIFHNVMGLAVKRLAELFMLHTGKRPEGATMNTRATISALEGHPRVSREELKAFVESMGRKTVCKALNISNAAISTAMTNGPLPASWSEILKALCQVRSIEYHPKFFNFKQLPATYGKGDTHAL